MRFTSVFLLVGIVSTVYAKSMEYGALICHQPAYHCLKITRANSWNQLFPNPQQRDLVKRINRISEFLDAGMIIAVPKQLENRTLFDFSPFPLTIAPPREKIIKVDLGQLAWGAFDKEGNLVKWGPLSAGTQQCLESDKGCSTPTGVFHIQRKKGLSCFSKSLPQTISGESGGAYMPYCMYFYQGYALHGSQSLPGYNASHGCIRLLMEDALWLNEIFVESANKHKHTKGTKLFITTH